MSNRATEIQVKEIIDTTLTAEQVAPFLNTANNMVTDICLNQGYGTETLKQIELWLAAHLVAIRDPRVSKEKIGMADATYHGTSGMGLDHTPYGQQVMIIDHKGLIAAAAKAKRPAEVKAII